jgi:hypothetical protein
MKLTTRFLYWIQAFLYLFDDIICILTFAFIVTDFGYDFYCKTIKKYKKRNEP